MAAVTDAIGRALGLAWVMGAGPFGIAFLRHYEPCERPRCRRCRVLFSAATGTALIFWIAIAFIAYAAAARVAASAHGIHSIEVRP